METTTFSKGRVIGFSDAVFSIAMTLLVLEIAPPLSNAIKSKGTLGVLNDLIPSFIGFIVSFFVTAFYWIAHMRITKYVSKIDYKLLWVNIFLLLFVILLPFSTAFYVNGFNYVGPFVFYCFNLSGLGFFIYYLLICVIKKEKGANGLTPLVARWHKTRALNAFSVWVLAGIMAFIFPLASRFLFFLIFIFQAFIDRYYKRKLKQEIT